MKTRSLIIIGIIIAIAISMIPIFLVYNQEIKLIIGMQTDAEPSDGFPGQIPEREYYEIEITGLKDIYLMGEQYDFSYIISGYGYPCGSKKVSFPDEHGEITKIISSSSCIAGVPMEEFVFDIKKELGTTFGHITLQNPGTYTVTVTFDRPSQYFPTTVSKEFRVPPINSWYYNQMSDTDLQTVLDSCTNDSPKERMANSLRYSNGTHVFMNLGCEWKKIGKYVGNIEFETDVKNCNGVDGREELECFANSFESCNPAMINYVIYTIEGDPRYLSAVVNGNEECSIDITFDNTQDRFSHPNDRIITKDRCSSIEFTKHTMNIGNCDNFDYQLNYESPDWASHEKCKSIGGEWDYKFHNCIDFNEPTEASCENSGGTISCMSDGQKGHGRDVCVAICEFEVVDTK
ncbi:MAG: DUF4362 domain-containing protein [Nitrosopumilus sp.]|uniref:DUF4362 domain-containing protein n=1 Tax=Nitrosopumilus sp. TaxID=2024843 RepID=UPI00247EC073|nr:DUF4362 domain-containing protein [Nitrosopumilus sp.]MCV0392790.1 DUF4362 domain-containing protein [Nitrosopumilus sp.]